jgi:hypothetical protein
MNRNEAKIEVLNKLRGKMFIIWNILHLFECILVSFVILLFLLFRGKLTEM